MFTGIISGVGSIVSVRNLGSSLDHGKQLRVQAPPAYLADVALGDSIALNGACMTVTELDLAQQQFCIDISVESLQKTTGLDKPGPINLEKALRAQDFLGGHIVSGHVDGIATVQSLTPVGESWQLRLLLASSMAHYFAYKGSVTVNGVSLTVNSVQDHAQQCAIAINLIPHTLQNTCLGQLTAGDHVNIEVDTIARYVERMLSLGDLRTTLKTT